MYHGQDRFQLVDRLGLKVIRPPRADRPHGVRVNVLIFGGIAQRRGRVAGRPVRLCQPKQPRGRGRIGRKGLVHIHPLAALQRQTAEFLVPFGIVGGKHNDAVRQRNQFRDGIYPLHVVFLAPCVGCQPVGGIGFGVGIGDLDFPARQFTQQRRVVVGVPFVQIIVNKSQFHGASSVSAAISRCSAALR